MGDKKHEAAQASITDTSAGDAAPTAITETVELPQKDVSSEEKGAEQETLDTTAAPPRKDAAPLGESPAAQGTEDSDKKSSPAPADSHDEGLSRKRDREGSVEPSFAAAKASSSDALPAKKNRILSTSSSSGGDKTTAAPTGDNEKVGQIRQRVEELSYDERQTKRTDTGAKRSVSPADKSKGDAEPAAATSTSSSSSQPGQASSASVSASASAPKSTSPTPVRTQPTFSSFSSSASPFSTAIAGVSGPSWLAGSSSSSSPIFGNGKARSGGMSGTTGALKPSALGGGGDDAKTSTSSSVAAEGTASPSPKPSSSASGSSTPAPSSKGPSLGFGAFAGSRPFTKAAGAVVAPTTAGEQSNEIEKPQGSKNIFDKADQADDTSSPSVDAADGAEADATKVKVQKMDHEQLTTGEENERTVHSVRCKLYAMNKDGQDGTAIDGTWKEKGTGTVRVNVPLNYMRHPKGHGSRLVMRSEGVLRLILNVALFHGMKVELAGDKFVRFVALEDAKLIHFALKVPNPVAAASLYRAITSHIPTSPSETSNSTSTSAPAAVSKATGYVMKDEEAEAEGDVEAQGGASASANASEDEDEDEDEDD